MAFTDVIFGSLDLREYKVAARRWNIKCSKECPLYVFKPDEPAEEPYLVEMQLLYEMDEMAMMTDPMAGAPGHTPKAQNIKPNLNRLMPAAITKIYTVGELTEFRRAWFNVVLAFG